MYICHVIKNVVVPRLPRPSARARARDMAPSPSSGRTALCAVTSSSPRRRLVVTDEPLEQERRPRIRYGGVSGLRSAAVGTHAYSCTRARALSLPPLPPPPAWSRTLPAHSQCSGGRSPRDRALLPARGASAPPPSSHSLPPLLSLVRLSCHGSRAAFALLFTSCIHTVFDDMTYLP